MLQKSFTLKGKDQPKNVNDKWKSNYAKDIDGIFSTIANKI